MYLFKIFLLKPINKGFRGYLCDKFSCGDILK